MIEVTRHAALRYGERVRTAVQQQTKRARAEVALLVRSGTPQAEPPPWMLADAYRYPAGTEYVMLGPDVALVVQSCSGRHGRITRVITVMTPWDQGACHRADRRSRRAERHRRLHPPSPPHTRRRPRYDDVGYGYDPYDWLIAG